MCLYMTGVPLWLGSHPVPARSGHGSAARSRRAPRPHGSSPCAPPRSRARRSAGARASQVFAATASSKLQIPRVTGAPERRPVREDSSISVMICQRGRTSTMSKFVFQVAMPKNLIIIFARLSFLNCNEGEQKVTSK